MIRVGGATEVEVKERKDRVDDAMHATRAAVEEGIVPGGGVALLRASEHLKGLRTKNDDQKTGVEIVRKALSYPARQIAINAGEDGSVIVGKILEKDQYAYGFDFADRRIRQPGLQGHHRPDQGGSCGDPERGFGCGSPDHHRSHGGRTAEEERWRSACPESAAEWAVWVVWISKSNCSEHNGKKGPAAMPGLLRQAAHEYVRVLGFDSALVCTLAHPAA